MKTTTFQSAYDNKKASSEKRHIPFELTLEEYTTLMLLRNTLTCAYTDRAFVMNKGTTHDHYPTLERIDPLGSYNTNNVLLCTKISNSNKQKFIEAEGSLKGANAKTISMVHRMNKILSHPENLERILKPYKEAYNINSAVDNKQKQLAQENATLRKKQKLQDKAKKEVAFAKHYVTLVEGLTSIGAEVECSIGEMRKKIMNTKKCQITGKPFNNLSEKKLYIIRKADIIDKDNFKVVHESVQIALDTILVGKNAKVLLRNLKKIL